ncbi:MlaA family lipoprotein [Porphyrobacter sp. LM 6]|uniref:MlaA family lipoprotein n=1 Tax=Porphyrobacter sp. LM 6 TaxID=1896196 RepID=UPI0009F3FFFE|nr:VacJ family lipoprotein [Porphyrobacter sp. LM 6]
MAQSRAARCDNGPSETGMPSLALLAASPSLLSAALSLGAPPVVEAVPAGDAAPQEWTLPPAPEVPLPQDTPPETAETPPPEGEAAAEEEVTEIVVEGTYGPPAGDPVEQFNAESYRLTQAVDSAVIEPVAYAYRDGLPEPIRDGLGNVVRNLGEPSNALNFLLQGKVGKAFETLGRLAINSTLGVGGLFDVAKKPGIGLPYRRNGFANTLGFYGVGPGPYLYLPVTGATTARDLFGSTLDQALLPFVVGKPFDRPAYAATYFVVNGLDQRLAFDEELARIEASDDPYGVRRDTYLAKRRADIATLKGEPVAEEDRLLLEEMKMAPPAAPAPADGTAPVETPPNPEALLITQPR